MSRTLRYSFSQQPKWLRTIVPPPQAERIVQRYISGASIRDDGILTILEKYDRWALRAE
jgi:hypothetical protein